MAVNQHTRTGFATALGVLAALVIWQLAQNKIPALKTSLTTPNGY